jgi:hypothetical protein
MTGVKIIQLSVIGQRQMAIGMIYPLIELMSMVTTALITAGGQMRKRRQTTEGKGGARKYDHKN